MLEFNYFECEVCGKRFEDSWECQFHELGHMAQAFPHEDLLMWKEDGELITVEELLENYGLLDSIYAVETVNEIAREYLRKMFDNYSSECPYENRYFPNEDGLIYWDGDYGVWVCYENKLAEVHAIRTKFQA